MAACNADCSSYTYACHVTHQVAAAACIVKFAATDECYLIDIQKGNCDANFNAYIRSLPFALGSTLHHIDACSEEGYNRLT